MSEIEIAIATVRADGSSSAGFTVYSDFDGDRLSMRRTGSDKFAFFLPDGDPYVPTPAKLREIASALTEVARQWEEQINDE